MVTDGIGTIYHLIVVRGGGSGCVLSKSTNSDLKILAY